MPAWGFVAAAYTYIAKLILDQDDETAIGITRALFGVTLPPSLEQNESVAVEVAVQDQFVQAMAG